MEYTINNNGKSCQVSLEADLTAAIAVRLQADLREHLKSGLAELVFDFRTIKMIDSTGIGLLIASSNTLSHAQGKVRVVNTSPDIFQLLQSMRLVSRLNVSAPTNGE